MVTSGAAHILETGGAEAGTRVPKDYKHTEVGMIPEDWEIVSLSSLTNPKRPISYGIVQTGQNVSNGVRCLRVLDINNGRINRDNLITTTKEISNSYSRTVLETGDLVMPLRGKIGDVAMVDSDLAGCNLTRGVALLAIRPDWSASFCQQCISSPATRSRLDQSMNGSALQEIPIATLRNFRIALPPTKTEQEAIAEALSDADALIESLEQLIAKKRQIKQGAMQELLTGKKRLPGFEVRSGYKQSEIGEIPVDWQLRPLLTAVQIARGQVDPKLEPYKSMFLVGPVHVESGTGRLVARQTASEQGAISGKYLFADGDVVYGKINPYLRKAFLADFSGLCSADMYPLRPSKDVSAGFMLAVILGRQFTNYAESVSVRSGMPKINREEMEEFVFPIPSDKVEQTAIATVLSDMDNEIIALESKLAKARQIKQGMMQELLTGRIRLPLPSAKSDSILSKQQRADKHSTHFNEAVVLAIVVHSFGSDEHPLGRFRRTKFSYLLHRHVENDAPGYLKKAAGPYNPTVRYGGAEKIALNHGYVREHKTEKANGFVAGDKIKQATGYFEKWYGAEAVRWLEQFRFTKNDDLELLTTVDMACQDLHRDGKVADLAAVKEVIREHPEWNAKLRKSAFSDEKINAAINKCCEIFDAN